MTTLRVPNYNKPLEIGAFFCPKSVCSLFARRGPQFTSLSFGIFLKAHKLFNVSKASEDLKRLYGVGAGP